ncbi:MAG: DUF4272 domain-containing protein [Christensenellaceae bacterium]|jgi:hypothetical protein|nr:DUF4272 domain-containing protein [Christensenellaceae bacterium]
MIKSKFAPEKKLREMDNGRVRVLHDKKEIMARALPLSLVCALSETGTATKSPDAKAIIHFIKKNKMKKALSPKELKFVFNKKKNEREVAEFNWHYERLGVLLWAIGYDNLPGFDKMVDASELIRTTHDPEFIEKAVPRSIEELIEYERVANEAYWICVDSKLNGKTVGDYSGIDINPEVALERLVAIRWIVGEEAVDWDGVLPDTYCPYARECGGSDKK